MNKVRDAQAARRALGYDQWFNLILYTKMYFKRILIHLIVQFLVFLPIQAKAETIVLNTAKHIIVDKAWEEDNYIWFIFQGMKACIPKYEVKEIVRTNPKHNPSQSRHKAEEKILMTEVTPRSKEIAPTQISSPPQVTPSLKRNASQPNNSTYFRKDGFRDLRWGVNVALASDLQKRSVDTGLDDVIEYDRPSDPLTIGDAELVSIIYAFWKDQLYTVTILTHGQSNYTQIRDMVFSHYGQGYRCHESPERYLWSEGLTDVLLKYNEEKKQGTLWLRSKELDRKYKLSKMNGHSSYLKWMNSN